MQYLVSRYREYEVGFMRDIYITDTLKVINENVSEICGGKVIIERYFDKVEPKTETRTSAEIIEQIKSGLEQLNGRI